MRFPGLFRGATVVVASILACLVALPAQAVDDIDSSSFIVGNGLRVSADQYSGAFTYSYPFTIPPGRNGMQPSLGLSYSSAASSNDNLAGYGWSLSIPTIERINRYGGDDLYDRHDFTSSLSGELEDISLTDATHGTFGAKVDDGSFLAYTYATDETWVVTDKRGATYTFGTGAQVTDPSDSTHVYRWYLTEIRDRNDNTITYTYTTDGNQVYPATINYTGNGTSVGLFDIAFSLESRSDATTSYAAGFAVTTSYRLHGIAVAVDGVTVRDYVMAYTAGANGVRSLLSGIAETGTDEATLGTATRPDTTFGYSAADSTWTEDTSFVDLPVTIAGTGSGSLGVYLFDVNGDALPDIVQSRDTSRAVYINNGDRTWTEDASISVPLAFASSIGRDTGVRVLDMDGDGALDLVRARYDSMGLLDEVVYINNGDGTGWTEDTAITVPIGFTTDGGLDIGVRTFDVDGDGMQDIVKSRLTGSGIDDAVYVNNGDGTGWTEDTAITVPLAFVTLYPRDMGVRQFDVNGDGLVDLVYARYVGSIIDEAVYINNGDGTGWTEDTSYTVPAAFLTSGESDMGVRPMDVNGDGLYDLVYSRDQSGTQVDAAYVNDGDGTGWTEDTSFVAPLGFTTESGVDLGVRELDVDGDGRDDILRSRDTGVILDNLYLAASDFADRLETIDASAGGTTAVTYTPYLGGDLTFPLSVIATTTIDDGLGNASTTSYSFQDGDFYYADEYDRRFAGFGTVETTDGAGNVKVEYFHQGNGTNTTQGESTDDVSKIGKRYREELYDDTATLYRTIIESWTNYDLGNGRDFVYANQSLELLYDGDSDHRDKATVFTYDTATGNMSERIDYGLGTGTDAGVFTDTGTDLVRTSYTYAAWTTGGTSSYPTAEILRDSSSNRWRHTRWFYDGQAFGYLTTGNATTVSQWVVSTTSLDTTYTYDAYGLVATQTDPRGMTTTYTPDADNLYPATVTDELGHAVSYVYDYSLGKPTEVTDMNGYASQTDYDGLDRPVTIWQPDPDAPTTLVEKTTYSYDDTSTPTSVHQTDYVDATLTRDTYTYLDGFGRAVQTRKEAEGTDTYDVADIHYDELGRVAQTSLPYSGTGSAYTTATTDTALYETLTYDALGRVASSTNVEGTSTKSYEDWWVTEVDANGETKLYYSDAFGRLTTVGERLGTSTTYTTSYTWTAGGDLAKITDGASNIRQFSYDNMGRRTVARDLRSTTDGAYGIWNYTFDSSSNLATSVSPIGVTTTYAYDDANRVTSEDASSASGTEVTYAYDTCTNGVGRVCTVTVSGGATTAYTYDALGRVSSETKTISGTAYTTSYEYDRQGGVTSVTYPDGSVATYGFDNAGGMEEVWFNDAHGTATETIVSGQTYTPTGKVATVTYGNDVTSTFTYDAADLYRLTDLVTTSGASNIQDFTYTFDSVGNLTNLVDASSLYAGMSVAYVYDDLYRLTQAASTSTDSALTYTKNWTYGAIGNILTSTDHGTYQYLGYQAGNYANPHAVTKIGTTTLTYDRNGNMTSDGTWTNAWNWRNEMTSSTNGTTTVTYAYDHDGNRVKQSNGTTTTIYPNGYYTVDGTETKRHIMAGALGSVATSTWDGTASELVYHHKDHLGGTHVETDESGSVLEYIVYKPFGGTLVDTTTGSYSNDHKFTGKEKDSDTGYYYYGARYYMADYGRFMSQDPVYLATGTQNSGMLADPQLLNSYSYARNNPIRLVDPDGNWPTLAGLASRFDAAFNFTMTKVLPPVANGVDAAYNFVTLGAGEEAARMGAEGVTVSGIARTAGGVAFGTASLSLAALDVGMAAGGLAVDLGLATSRQQPSFEQRVQGTLTELSNNPNAPRPTQDYINVGKVQEYYQQYTSGQRVAPIEVIKNGNTQTIIDGHHRFVASQMAGVETSTVQMGTGALSGTWWDNVTPTK